MRGLELPPAAYSQGAGERGNAGHISQGADGRPRVEEASTVLSLGFSAASQAAEKVHAGDNQMPSWAGHIFPG